MQVPTDKIDTLATALRDLEALLKMVHGTSAELPAKQTDTVVGMRDALSDINAEIRRIRRVLAMALLDQQPVCD